MLTDQQAFEKDLEALRLQMSPRAWLAWLDEIQLDEILAQPGNQFEIQGPGSLNILIHVWKPSPWVRAGTLVLNKMEDLEKEGRHENPTK